MASEETSEARGPSALNSVAQGDPIPSEGFAPEATFNPGENCLPLVLS